MFYKNRKTNRLPGYDYSKNGWYFVTINVHNVLKGQCVLGEVFDGKMVLNEYGEIVYKKYNWLFKQYHHIKKDNFIIMPDHFHGIIEIIEPSHVRTGRDLSVHKKPLSQIVGAFKTTTSKLINQLGICGFKWQRSFYDRIIRNENELNRIRKYIINNPANYSDGMIR